MTDIIIKDLLFTGDASVASHLQQQPQSLTPHIFQTCKDFRLTISLKKKKFNKTWRPSTYIYDDKLKVDHQFIYLCSNIWATDTVTNKRIGKAAAQEEL